MSSVGPAGRGAEVLPNGRQRQADNVEVKDRKESAGEQHRESKPPPRVSRRVIGLLKFCCVPQGDGAAADCRAARSINKLAALVDGRIGVAIKPKRRQIGGLSRIIRKLFLLSGSVDSGTRLTPTPSRTKAMHSSRCALPALRALLLLLKGLTGRTSKSVAEGL
jgi:hypothetical protein